ncbi:MAG: hypothetical protein RLZZ416_445 [Candidatus Parcubacteria bacterium]|jgi:hypothetical protein
MWLVAGILALAVGALAFVALRPTSVTVTPKSHALVLTEAIPLTAYPSEGAPPGTLTYTVKTADAEDSEVVPSQGTTHAERKASGAITIVNNYSGAPVNLVKSTRFEAPGGLIYRIAQDVTIPGKKGSVPGELRASVVADQVGEKYNIGPTAKFTLPGLKSNAAMYTGVTARSDRAMSGGFVGEEPGTAPGAVDTARATIRGRLEIKARAAVSAGDTSIIVPGLTRITYTSLPNGTEKSGVRIGEKARVETAIFDNGALASAIAHTSAADADSEASVRLVPGKDFSGSLIGSPNYGSDPIQLALTGNATLIWKVDEKALAAALAGRDQGAFQVIVNGFPSVEEAHARIEPFWRSTFPDASKIRVSVIEPKITE